MARRRTDLVPGYGKGRFGNACRLSTLKPIEAPGIALETATPDELRKAIVGCLRGINDIFAEFSPGPTATNDLTYMLNRVERLADELGSRCNATP